MRNGLNALRLVATLLAVMPFVAQATPIAYYVDAYQYGGYSASWVHSAESCTAGASDLDVDGVPGDDQLCMNGSVKIPITGQIVGEWQGGSFNVSGGHLGWLSILDGNLGGAYYDVGGNPLWFLDVGFGASVMTFYFEDLREFFGSDQSYPNTVTPIDMVLWGQNLDAYSGCGDQTKSGYCSPLGLDIYARVPEPAGLALLSIGLLLVGFSGRHFAARKSPALTS